MKIKDYLAIGILTILTVVYFWKFFFLGLLPMGGDITTYTYPPWYYCYQAQDKSQNPLLSDPVFLHYPLRKLAVERLKEGKITLWNPYIFCGNPHFSTNSVSFSPLNIFFLFFEPLTGWSLILICQMLLSGIFMYIFLRGSLNLARFGALIGGIIYEFSGFAIVWLEMGILSGFLLPLILFLIDKAIIKRSIFYVMLAGTALGMQFLSTFLQISLFVLLAIIPYSLFRIFSLRAFKFIPFVGLVFIIGFSLSAIQLVPSYELIRNSHREPVKDYRMLSPLPWQNLITLLVPNYYGNPVDYNYNIIRPHFREIFKKYGLNLPPLHPKRGRMEDNYNEHCAYMGILPLILALLSIFLKRNKNTLYFSSFTLISLLLTLGTPLYYLLYVGIPGCDKLIISRFIFLYTFGVAVLAGLGSNYIFNTLIKVYSISIILLFGLIIIISLYLGKFVARFYINATLLQHFTLSNIDFLCPILLLIISGVILLSINRVRNLYIKILIFGIIIFDIFGFGMRYNPFVHRNVLYTTTPSLRFLADKITDEEKSRILGFEHILPVSINIIYGFETAEGYDGMFTKRYDEFINLVAPEGCGWENAKELDYSANRNLLCLLNTKYLLTSKKIKADNLKLIFDKEIKIYEDLSALPRVWIVSEAKLLKTKEKIFKELRHPDFDPRETVILEEEYKKIQNPKSNLKSSSGQSPKCQILDYQPERVVIKATLNKSGFLVLSDAYYPGWQVFVDGREERLFCANYILRAVYLTAGKHLVEFRYSPLSFRIGCFFSILTLIILIFLMTLTLFNTKK
ncbi:MAG: YfhO family protein [bacterium]